MGEKSLHFIYAHRANKYLYVLLVIFVFLSTVMKREHYHTLCPISGYIFQIKLYVALTQHQKVEKLLAESFSETK